MMMPVCKTTIPQNPVEVPLYALRDVARYLRVPWWLALAFIERVQPHPEWLFHRHCWRVWQPSPNRDDSPFVDFPVEFSPISFRRFADLYVRTFIVQAAAEWGRAPVQDRNGGGHQRSFWRTIGVLIQEKELFGEGGADQAVAGLIERVAGQKDEIGREWMERWLRMRLERIELSEGVPVRLYPFSRDPVGQSPRSVVMDPRIRFGRPTVEGHGTPTDVLFERHQAGDSIAELAEDYGLTPDEVEEAIRYEAAHPVPVSPCWGMD